MLRPGGPRSRWTRWLRILAVCGMTFQMRGFVLGALSPRAARSVRLQAAGDSDKNFNKQKFLRRPEFDPLSLQDFRREALLQYSNTNQSEPLRILIFLFLTICGLFSPTFFPSNAGPPFFVAAATVTLTSGFLFLRERGKRTAQLVRLEREYSIGDLSVELSDPVSGRSESKELQASCAATRKPEVALQALKPPLPIPFKPASATAGSQGPVPAGGPLREFRPACGSTESGAALQKALHATADISS